MGLYISVLHSVTAGGSILPVAVVVSLSNFRGDFTELDKTINQSFPLSWSFNTEKN